MTVTRAQLVAQARTWFGTPVKHQGQLKDVGVDCIGLVRGVCRELEIKPSPEKIAQAGQRFYGYGRTPDGVLFKEFCDTFMVRISTESAQPADVILLQYRHARPQHVAILGDSYYGGLSMIHALRDRVTEHQLDDPWRRRIVAAYSIPGVE